MRKAERRRAVKNNLIALEVVLIGLALIAVSLFGLYVGWHVHVD